MFQIAAWNAHPTAQHTCMQAHNIYPNLAVATYSTAGHSSTYFYGQLCNIFFTKHIPKAIKK